MGGPKCKSKDWAPIFSQEASHCVFCPILSRHCRIVNTLFVQQGEAETQCRRERKDLPEQQFRETQGGEDGISQGRNGTSERPWGRLEVRSVEQLLSPNTVHSHLSCYSHPSELDI